MPKRTERRWWQFSDELKAPNDIPTPDCFTEPEWGAYYEAEYQATWNKKSVKDRIGKDMCEDCTLSYQKEQIRKGKCQPQYGAMTPLHRVAMLAAGEEDPIEKEEQYLASSWPKLSLLRGGLAGPSEDGAGEEEGARHADDSLVLPE